MAPWFSKGVFNKRDGGREVIFSRVVTRNLAMRLMKVAYHEILESKWRQGRQQKVVAKRHLVGLSLTPSIIVI